LRVGRRRLRERFHELLRETTFASIVEVFAAQVGTLAVAAPVSLAGA
jgi:hypothetical protein